eukprot:3390623-Alexandrium_andersonii.AAC.1
MSLTDFEEGASEAKTIAQRALQPDIRSPDGFVVKMASRRAIFTPVTNADGSLQPGALRPSAEGALR